MFAWQLQCSPVTWPAWAMQSSPVWTPIVPAHVEHRDLPDRGERIGGQQLAERLLGRYALGEPVERVRAVGGLDDGLRGHRADPGPRPRAQRTDGEPVRLDRDAEFARLRIEGHD